jgi:hypothetical protein
VLSSGLLQNYDEESKHHPKMLKHKLLMILHELLYVRAIMGIVQTTELIKHNIN